MVKIHHYIVADKSWCYMNFFFFKKKKQNFLSNGWHAAIVERQFTDWYFLMVAQDCHYF